MGYLTKEALKKVIMNSKGLLGKDKFGKGIYQGDAVIYCSTVRNGGGRSEIKTGKVLGKRGGSLQVLDGVEYEMVMLENENYVFTEGIIAANVIVTTEDKIVEFENGTLF
ncbi:hypothetical protein SARAHDANIELLE_28 [Hafnia phage vB_HpaM_SarahDanielle]|uniref:Uncharacterized protein n=1 Tax=Hafnia phage vB_HpaM_SarahDanielle TaxID=2836113 RepID=A0AAE7W9E0_9CAUD|nr:hypothetical protein SARAHDANIELLE_28 [Hafnia phage vB_HpaM_SarahDanielle]